VEKKYLFLGIGILSLVCAYGLFNGDQYFSAIYMFLLLVLVLLSLTLMILAYAIDENSAVRDPKVLAGIVISFVSFAIILLEANFAVLSEPVYSAGIETTITLVFLAALTSAIAYVISYALKDKKGASFYLAVIVCIIVSSLVIGELRTLMAPESSLMVGTDELGFDYYASNFFLIGINPYATDFSSVLVQTGIWPTTYLNGSCQCRYVYPPLAFIALVPFALVIHDYAAFLHAVLTIISAMLVMTFIVLFRCGRNDIKIFVPTFGIALAIYLISPWSVVKCLTMTLLMFAYIFRKNAVAYPILLGISASVHELSWMIIPFFLVLTAREEGVRNAIKSAMVALIAFLAIISFFLLMSPEALIDSLGANNAWIQPMGINVMQFLTSFYPVVYDSLVPFPFILYGLMLLAFAFYKKYRAIMCVAATITFVFWAYSSISYTTVFMPLLVYLVIERHFERDTEYNSKPESVIEKKYVILVIAATAILFLTMVAFGHDAYLNRNPPLKFGEILPILDTSNGTVTLTKLILFARGTLANDTVGTLQFVSMKPNFIKGALLTNLMVNGTGDQYTYYDVPILLENVTNSTIVKIFVTLGHYIRAIEVPLNGSATETGRAIP
jgi:uncharacterized membrane protein